jgi:integration host factor subunit alpha
MSGIMIDSLMTSSLTKLEITDQVYAELGISKREAREFVDLFFDVLCQKLIAGEDIKLAGFGNFTLHDKVERPGRNPRTGEAATISARRVVTFHASAKLKDHVQGKSTDESEDGLPLK